MPALHADETPGAGGRGTRTAGGAAVRAVPSTSRRTGPAGAVLAVVLVSAACTPTGSATAPGAGNGRASAAAGTTAGSPTIAAPPPAAASGGPPAGGLLVANGKGDGDSWKDSAGREYRLGLVNTPEVGECYGSQATAARKRLVMSGFRAAVYTTDRYGRSVSVVTSADGTNVNVWLARHGFADDRYLAQFRAENPALAAQLDPAFGAAKAERAGLWRACPHPG